MGFRREIHHSVDLVCREQPIDEIGITDAAMGENIARIACEVGEVCWISGVGERVQIDEPRQRGVLLGEPLADEIRTDEAAAAGAEEILRPEVEG